MSQRFDLDHLFLRRYPRGSKEADCKSVGESLRRFDSYPAHHVLVVYEIRHRQCRRIWVQIPGESVYPSLGMWIETGVINIVQFPLYDRNFLCESFFIALPIDKKISSLFCGSVGTGIHASLRSLFLRVRIPSPAPNRVI